MVLKSFTLKPTKPNSGNRKVCKVRLANGAVRIGQFFDSDLCKVKCVFPMVIAYILPHAEFGPNEHREYSPD